MQSPIPERPTFIEVDLDALARNFRRISDHVAPARVMPVVKANAYGHGLLPCARLLEAVGAHSLGVACLEEGIELRKGGIRIPILVFGGIWGEQIEHFINYSLDL